MTKEQPITVEDNETPFPASFRIYENAEFNMPKGTVLLFFIAIVFNQSRRSSDLYIVIMLLTVRIIFDKSSVLLIFTKKKFLDIIKHCIDTHIINSCFQLYIVVHCIPRRFVSGILCDILWVFIISVLT